MAQEISQQKLAELIIYFTYHSQDDQLFGMTKLNKMLWLADFKAYGYMGQSITGATYVHQVYGPTVDPRELMPVFESLTANGRLYIEQEETYLGVKKRPKTDSLPNTEPFTEDELDLCADIVQEVRRMSGTELSDISHRFAGWKKTSQGEEIPYHTAFLLNPPAISQADIDWATETAKRLGFSPQ